MTPDAQFWELAASQTTPPPQHTIQWVERQMDATVRSCEPLAGGLSSAVHRLEFDQPDLPAAVMRRFTLADWLVREPFIPSQEAHILTLLASLNVGVDTPTLLAADPEGRECDVPTIIMTMVEGHPDISPIDAAPWAEKLAACLADIHRTPLPHGLPEHRRWDNPSHPPPTWAEREDLWTEAKIRSTGPLPNHPVVFIHRDYHPNNIHWSNGDICGVVDWLSACRGPIAADVAHCRWNLAILVDAATADHFTDHYRALTGYSDDTIAFDLSTVLSAPRGPFPTFAWNDLGRTDLTSASVGTKIEQWLAHLLVR